MNLQVDALVATIISSITIVASAIFVVVQLRQAARDRYFAITSHLFEIWQSPEFQEDQLFLLHKLTTQSWRNSSPVAAASAPSAPFIAWAVFTIA
jgi:hypothetical protein